MSRRKPVGTPFWTADEFSRILAACRRLSGFGDNLLPRAAYALALFHVVQETGLSRYWLWRLRTSQLREDGRIVLPGWRTFQLSPEAHAAILAMSPHSRDLLLPWVNGRRGFYNLIGRILDRAGIRGDRRLHRTRKGNSCVAH